MKQLSKRRSTLVFFCLLAFSALVSADAATPNLQPSAADRNPARVAAEVDRLLAEEALQGKQIAPEVDDATYLRRVSLDIIGEPPTPAEITAFVLDPASDKRSRVVAKLLANPLYGQNWARYWRDVIMARRSNDRALGLAGNSVVVHLTEQFNQGRGWDAITRSFITATGKVRSQGSTALSIAHEGKPEETAAETARVFLGIQLQCAQCHDHPYDSWKREQFHQLAAYFPRVVVRPLKQDVLPDFEITSIEKVRGGGRNKALPEHYMSDLKDPKAKGTLTQPLFFLGGEKEEVGMTDRERRATLAARITSRDNPWFAKALVNRIWAELLGRGFYEPIDDLGADRKCAAPKTVDYLTRQFVDSGYDLRWLIKTITATAAYQRQGLARAESDKTPFSAVAIQPLRADVLFSALSVSLQVYDLDQVKPNRRGRPEGPRLQFDQVFGFDPSQPRDEVTASISQALLMMNSPQLARAMRADTQQSPLGRLATAVKDDDQVLEEIYLRTLSREPSDTELAQARAHIKQTGNRGGALEDILWALVNSAEFRERR
ncbi:MAG: DUF1549 and DUF1553 domain-containing protein [Planctomycetes bacterium]|nr:DUF1549 and DUF1553 domain-containing protein [Planctomycetota bacterium]